MARGRRVARIMIMQFMISYRSTKCGPGLHLAKPTTTSRDQSTTGTARTASSTHSMSSRRMWQCAAEPGCTGVVGRPAAIVAGLVNRHDS